MPATDRELRSSREQAEMRKEMLKASVQRFADLEDFRQEHLQVNMVFQKDPGGDTIVIQHINWEAPIRQSIPGNPDDPLFPPDFPVIPPDPKKRGDLWDPKKRQIKPGSFKSVFKIQSQHYDQMTSMHHLVWYRDVDEKVQFQRRTRGFKSPNAKNETLPLPKFLTLIQGWIVVAQE